MKGAETCCLRKTLHIADNCSTLPMRSGLKYLSVDAEISFTDAESIRFFKEIPLKIVQQKVKLRALSCKFRPVSLLCSYKWFNLKKVETFCFGWAFCSLDHYSGSSADVMMSASFQNLTSVSYAVFKPCFSLTPPPEIWYLHTEVFFTCF